MNQATATVRSHMGAAVEHGPSAALDDIQRQIDELRGQLLRPVQSSVSTAVTVNAELVRAMLSARRARASHFGEGLFADPAWDILLELYAAHLSQVRVSVGAACAASAVPPSTAIRWIDKLEDARWLLREEDRLDSRRTWVRLTEQALSAMRDLFEVGRVCPGTAQAAP